MATTIEAQSRAAAGGDARPHTEEGPASGAGARLLPLDVLRAIAVFLVLGNHMPEIPRDMWLWLRKPLRLWQHAGWVGVDLFFVLSGFLISGLLFREYVQHRQMRIGRFLIRRGLKIYPGLYFLVLATVLGRLAWDLPLTARSILGELCFLQNYVGALWGHTWSLAVEEHFYLSLPVLLMILMWRGRGEVNPFRSLPMIFVLVALVELGLRLAMNLLYEYRHGSHKLVTHLRVDGLFFGVLLSYCYHFHQDGFVRFFRRWSARLLPAGALLVGPLLLLEPDVFVVPTVGLTLIFLLAGVLLSALLVCEFPRTRLTRGCGYIGSHSYSIYLWHYPCMVWGIPLIRGAGRTLGYELPWQVYTSLYMLASILLGILMAKTIEFPMLRIRDRLFPSLSRPLSAPRSGPAPGGPGARVSGRAGHPAIPGLVPGELPGASLALADEGEPSFPDEIGGR